MRRYRSEHNGRWEGFAHRDGDIVVSTRSKCGTTWMQMICLLLVHGTPDLPAPLAELSPWLDWDVEPVETVRARLDRQDHRRVIKTHTPLDGLPLDDRVTYVVVGRHPLDVAVSFFHHARNIDRARMRELTGRPSTGPAVDSVERFLDRWIDSRTEPIDALDTLAGNLHHLTDAWARAGGAPGPDGGSRAHAGAPGSDGVSRARAAASNVVIEHYEALEADLSGRMRALAGRLGTAVPEERWDALVAAAGFEAMRDRAADRAPDHLGVIADPEAFFRVGRSGDGRRLATADQRARYRSRAAALAPPAVLDWLHR